MATRKKPRPHMNQLEREWSEAWGRPMPKYIGRLMMERSLEFHQRQQASGGLPENIQRHLNEMVRALQRNPGRFNPAPQAALKPGARLMRTHNGQTHTVQVTEGGFEYQGRPYRSLSAIATEITGTRWNGLVFFGVKKERKS